MYTKDFKYSENVRKLSWEMTRSPRTRFTLETLNLWTIHRQETVDVRIGRSSMEFRASHSVSTHIWVIDLVCMWFVLAEWLLKCIYYPRGGLTEGIKFLRERGRTALGCYLRGCCYFFHHGKGAKTSRTH